MEEERRLEEAELWQLRAMTSERKSLLAEMTILRMKLEDLDGEIKVFQSALKNKYKCESFTIDGALITAEPGE